MIIRRGTANRLGLRQPAPPVTPAPALAALADALHAGVFPRPMAITVSRADLGWMDQVRARYELTQRARLLP